MKLNVKGFTLLEVLVSLIILAGTSIVLYQSWNSSQAGVRKGRLFSTITLLLQKKMVEFEARTKNKKVEEIETDSDFKSGDFGDDYPGYTWEVKMRPFTLPPIIPPAANGDKQSEVTTTIIKTMTDFFEKAVREISIVVTYKQGNTQKSYSLSTIYIDYTKELPIGF